MDATAPWSAPVDADDYYREIPTLPIIMRISGLLLVQEKTFPITASIHCMNIWEGRNR